MLGGFFSLPFGEKVVSLPRQSKNRQTMSEATLTNLLEYLYDTLTPNNMRWMAMNLMAHADSDEASLRPYTMEELHQMVAKGEQQFDEGKWQDSEDMFRELEEELATEKLQYSEAI